jgi:cytochrome b561
LTSGAILRTHAYRPLGQPANPTDLTLHTVHTRVGLLIFVLVALRVLLRIAKGTPDWGEPLPVWRRRLSLTVQYALYLVLLLQAATGAVASYLWWPMSAVHRASFWTLLVLIIIHLAGSLVSFVTRPRETVFRITGLPVISD